MRYNLYFLILILCLSNFSCATINVDQIERNALQGDAAAQNNLGGMYHAGIGVQKDYVKAMEWYQKAAEQGIAHAFYNIGDLHFRGLGVPQSNEIAFKNYKIAASHGMAIAQNNVGVFYMNGISVEKDTVEAYMWFLLAEKDFPQAKLNIDILDKILDKQEIEDAHQKAKLWKPLK